MGYYDWYNSSAAAPYLNDINGAAAQYNVDPAVLANQIGAESSFNPNAVSSSGAVGLGQFLPSTAANPGYGVQSFDPNNTTASIYGTAAYTQARGGYNANGLAAYSGGSYSADTTNNILAGSQSSPSVGNYSDNPLFSGNGYYDNISGQVLNSNGTTSAPAEVNTNSAGLSQNQLGNNSQDQASFWQQLLVRVIVGGTGLVLIGGGLFILGSQSKTVTSLAKIAA